MTTSVFLSVIRFITVQPDDVFWELGVNGKMFIVGGNDRAYFMLRVRSTRELQKKCMTKE